MTEAILVWQAFIFITLALAGRFRGWFTAFWVIWTIVQVATLPLSVIQFVTIALANFIFSGKKSATRVVAAPIDPEVETRRLVEAAKKQTELDEWKRERSSMRSDALVRMLLFGVVGVGVGLWIDHSGINGFSWLLLIVCGFGALKNMIKAMD